MGPAAPAAVIATVAAAELVPLLPTTPLAVGAGLLLSAPAGAASVLAGNLAAATGAFFISRGFGARFARRMIEAEGGGSGCPSSSSSPGGLWSRVSAAVGAGTHAEKFAAVAALRATPVIPFSLSSYALGLAPPASLPYGVYIAGTAAGASIWAGVYASIGAASRAALLACGSGSGGSQSATGAASSQPLEALVADLVDRAASTTSGAAGVAGVVVGGAALLWAGSAAAGRWSGGGGKAPEGPAP